jgi:hypothetical protein
VLVFQGGRDRPAVCDVAVCGAVRGGADRVQRGDAESAVEDGHPVLSRAAGGCPRGTSTFFADEEKAVLVRC